MKKSVTLVFALLLAFAFCLPAHAQATTPTGNVVLYLDTTAPCGPAVAGNAFQSIPLDATGAYSYSGTVNNSCATTCTFAVYAAYSGDATHNPSFTCQNLTVSSGISNTATSLTLTPSSITIGQTVTSAGSVTNSQ